MKSDAAAVLTLQRQEALAAEPARFAVTVEATGGVPAPTGEVVLAGERFPPAP